MTVLSNNESEQVLSAENMVGPGARLRKAREAQGLDQARAAAQLHLNEIMIEALELDDFDALPGAVFVQGYLRNYARLLGLPESEILAAYQQLRPAEQREKVSAKGPQKLKQEVHSSHSLVRLTSWLIVLGLVALLFLWWQGRFGWQTDVAESDDMEQEPMSEPFDQNGLIPEAPPETVSVRETEEPIDYATTTASGVTTADQLEPEEEYRFDPQPSEAVGDAESALSSVEEFDPITQKVEEQIVVESPVIPEPPPVEPEATGELVFEFSGTCWAEVRDASGKAHIIGEKKSGYRRVIDKNLGPFKVVLGNVTVVSVTLDGEPYDLTPHTTGNVARFSLRTE